MFFLTEIIGISIGWAGTIVMVSKIWDAINDPLMGRISDNTRTKIGRRRPFILIGGILLIPAMALLWLPTAISEEYGKVIYVLITYLFYFTINTVIMVPYLSMSTEVTTDFDERNKLNLLRLIFSLAATAVCTLVPTFLLDSVKKGNMEYLTFYFIIVLAFGIIFAIPQVLIGLFVKERVKYDEAKSKVTFKDFTEPLKVKSFRKLVILYICQALALDITSTIVLYFSTYVLTALSPTVFLGLFLGIQLIMNPVLQLLVKKVSKTKIYAFGLPLTIVCSILIAIYPSFFPIWGIYIIVALTAIGFSGAQLMSWIMFPDVVDIITLGNKKRNTGIYSGVMTFLRTASSALAMGIVGWVLELSGFIVRDLKDENLFQPDSAKLGIRLLFILAFGVLSTISYFVAKNFKLSPELSKSVKRLNDLHESSTALSSDDKILEESIIKEFI
jgi:GPH family glycoside/pentoside/hexuronide:cation symporter/oligogalacturonide transporter